MEPTGQREKTSIGEIILIIGAAVVSFSIGFFLVYILFAPETSPSESTSDAAVAVSEVHSSAPPEDAPAEEVDAQIQEESTEPQADEEAGDSTPEVPPGPTPAGIRLDGAPLYLKCWKDGSEVANKEDCDRLRVLEKRMATRLYVVDECRQKHASSDAKGILSLGANVDFSDNSIKFWSGPSSTLPEATKVGNCVRLGLAGLPLYEIDHRFERYRLFFSVNFFDEDVRSKELERLRRQGREVALKLDRVNVREKPVDGLSLGRLKTGTRVTLLGKSDDKTWCKVLTPADRVGWMICEALDI